MSNRKRFVIYLLILGAISSLTLAIVKFAQGYRPDVSEKTLRPTGLLVATSNPDGAQLWLDGKLKSATNTTLNLSPGEYQVEIKKEGFASWQKKLQIKKELVTQTNAHLFSTFPDLKALTFTGAASPLLSPDGQKVVFAVSGASIGKNGLWVLDLSDRPLGLSREPRQIIASAPGGRDFAQGQYSWSPDSKQVLLTLKDRPGPRGTTVTESFLLEADKTTRAVDLIDISENLESIFNRWQEEEKVRQEAKLNKLPKELLGTIDGLVDNLQFSPDESRLLYIATASAQIPEEIIPPLPAASTQPESRAIEPGKVYVYDIKEDKNFFIMEAPKAIEPSSNQAIEQKEEKKLPITAPQALSWFPTSKHLFLVQSDKISIIESDGTNWIDVYSGPFENSFAFPFPDSNRLLVLASIGKDTPPNLYAISLR